MSFIQSLPKIELHCHLDGSVRPDTLKELSMLEGLIQDEDLIHFESLIKVPEACDSLVEYLKCFKLPIGIMQSASNLERIARELVEDVAVTGVKYIEVRYAPHLHMDKGLSFETIVESVLNGLKAGEAATGTMARLILCCMRHLPVETSLEVVKLGHPYLGKGVVAVDLAGDEHNFPPELHEEAFHLAKALGYKITIHAGETGIGKNVTTAISNLHADRIGHGLFIKDDAEARTIVENHRIPLEMCPTSNVQTKGVSEYEAHPIVNFLRDGLPITLNTDNMTVSGITLNSEADLLESKLHATEADFWQLYENAIEAAFANEAEKQLLRSYLPNR